MLKTKVFFRPLLGFTTQDPKNSDRRKFTLINIVQEK
jgi:hypothetical protein